MRRVSFTDVPDATSGFRALSREAGQQTVVFSEYTYTLETIIQAGHRKLSVLSVPVDVNEDARPSRLVRSIPSYLKQSIITIVRIYVIYRPLHFLWKRKYWIDILRRDISSTIFIFLLERGRRRPLTIANRYVRDLDHGIPSFNDRVCRGSFFSEQKVTRRYTTIS